MRVSPQQDKYLHGKLPIDADEQVLAVYKHHWFAYVSSWAIGLIVVVLVMGIAVALTMTGDPESGLVQHREQIIALAGVFSTLVFGATSLPVYLRSQEQLVLTEEALVQVLQPSLFASKVDQLSLQHITDVSVQQDFFGTMLGYGQVIFETPGEQNNYHFTMLPDPHTAAREIIQAHENFDAALQGGRIDTTFSKAMPRTPQIDPEQYQQFLQYQQMVTQSQQNGQQSAQANDPTNSPQNQQ